MMRALRLVLASTCGCALFVTLALAQSESAPAEEQATDGTEDLARRSQIIARVSNTTITVGDVEDAVNKQSPFLRARYQDEQRLREFVDNMIRFELLAREAERRGYGKNPGVQRQIKQNAVQQLMRTEFNERITPETIPMADVEAYHQNHPEEFNRPELRRASHILLETREEALQFISKARSADARGFRELAREHSLDRETKLRGGDLRYFNEEGKVGNAPDMEVDQVLVRAAFSLQNVGDVVREPVQVGENFSLVKLTGLRAAEHRSVEQGAHEIRLRLWREQRQKAIEDFVTQLRERLSPEVFENRMEPIQLDPPAKQIRPMPHGGHAGHDHPPGLGPQKLPQKQLQPPGE